MTKPVPSPTTGQATNLREKAHVRGWRPFLAKAVGRFLHPPESNSATARGGAEPPRPDDGTQTD